MRLIQQASPVVLGSASAATALWTLHRQLRLLQRRRWAMYVAMEGILGILVGYYSVPRFHWFAVVVGALSVLVGLQLSVMRQHRRTWQSERIVALLDALERLCAGTMLVALSIYALVDNVPRDAFLGVTVWSAFWVVGGSAGGEYWWQWRYFPKMEASEQVRYLCRYLRR
ncbi:MAG: hypothetical protein KatS3mg039_0772 [Candidatus Kapaibacterium sp.]|nr:MAG: hypothetical protein KatS3mg039_0772 [Candidatus Kapabacteria bacterium]